VWPLEDSGSPRGHEYFPALHGGDRYLLFSASRGEKDHDHLSGNYQIFIRDLNANILARFTFDVHTNRWPKILPAAGPAGTSN